MPLTFDEYLTQKRSAPTFEQFMATKIDTTMPKPRVPESFTTTPLPASTAVVPMAQKRVGTLEPEEPTGMGAVLRNIARSAGRLVDPETISLGGKEIFDRITSEGPAALPSIAKQFGASLADVFKVWVYHRLPEEIKTPEVKRREKEAWRNIGLDPLAAPTTLGMAVAGGAGLARLAGRVATGAKVAAGAPKIRPIAEGKVPVTVKPKPRVGVAVEKPVAKPKASPTVAKAKVGKLTAEQDAGLAALDDMSAELYRQKEAALPTKKKLYDERIRKIGEQKRRLIEPEITTAEAGRVYVPVKEVRVATDKTLKALDLRTTPEEATIKEIDFTRRGDIAEADVRAGFAKREIQRVIPDLKRRELITQAQENPKLRGELSEIEKGVLNEIGRFYDEGFKKANKADVINSAVENYINHVWETADPKRKIFSGRYITTKTPFAKERKIPTIEAGKKMGLKPLTEDPAELMEIWARSVHRAIANKRAIDALKIIEAEDARLLIQPSTSAPSDYAFYDHPALRQYRWRGKAGKGAIYQTGVKVHPSIARAIDVAFGQNWRPRGKTAQAVFNAYTALDKAAKKSILTVSLFHWHALTESAIATGQSPLAFIRGAAKLVNNEELVVRARRAQLGISGSPDAPYHALRFERIPILKKTLGKGMEKWDRALWDKLHAGHKIEAFDRITRDALTNKKYSHLSPIEIDRTVATFVNDAFGGLDWEGLGVTAKQQWLLQRSLLAPDWTLSQIRVFKGMFRVGEKGSARRLSGHLYRAYWRRAIQYNLAGANVLNYAFTAWKAGDPAKGHFMIQNEPGHKFQLELPYAGSDGKPRWVQVGKQFMEPFRYVEDLATGQPLKTITGKMGPGVRIILAQATNQKWIGGPALLKEKDPVWMKYLKRAGYTVESVFPIPAQQWLGVAKGFKDPWDAAISSFGFPVKRDYGKRRPFSGVAIGK